MRVVLVGSDIHPPLSSMEAKFAEGIVRTIPWILPLRLSICYGMPAGTDPGYAYVDGFRGLPLTIRKLVLGIKLLFALLRQLAAGAEVFHFVWFAPRPVLLPITALIRAFRRRVVFTILSSDPDPGAFRFANGVTTAGPRVVTAFGAAGFPAGKVHLVPPPLLLPRADFPPAPAPPEPRYLLLSAPKTTRQIPQRGLPLLFDAFARLQERGRNARLTIMGRWVEGHGLIAEMIKRRLLDNVELRTEMVEDVFSEIRAVRGVFAIYNGRNAVDVPQSALEAVACGRVVIASRGLGLESYLEGYPGLILTDNTPANLADAVERGLAVDLARCEAEAAGYLAPFDLETFGARISELYRTLAR